MRRLPRFHIVWLTGTLLSVLFLFVISRVGPDWNIRGGLDKLAIAYGSLSLLLILLAIAYAFRKRLAKNFLGPLDRWMWAHIYFSVILIMALVLHVSLAATWGLGTVRWGLPMATFLVALSLVASGFLGRVFYLRVPSSLARRQAAVLAEVDQLNEQINSILEGKSTTLRRTLDPKARLVAGGIPEHEHWLSLRQKVDVLPEDEREAFLQVLDLLTRRGELWQKSTTQLGFSPLFRGWLMVHIVMAGALVGLVAFHVVDVYHPVRLGPERAEQFSTALECSTCHGRYVAQWSTSPHSQAIISPVMTKMTEAVAASLAKTLQGTLAKDALESTCTGCHTPIGTRLGEDPLVEPGDRAAISAEGITCMVCHGAVHAEGDLVVVVGTTEAPFAVHPSRKMFGPFGIGTGNDPRAVRNPFHKGVYSADITDAAFCQACHNVTIDKASLEPFLGGPQPIVRLQETFDEWQSSRYAPLDITCQTCHMPRSPELGVVAVAPQGESFERTLPLRTISDHSFTGVDYAFWEDSPQADAQRNNVAAFLRGVATLELSVPDSVTAGAEFEILVRVKNVGVGHDLPTGFVFEREVWLEVQVEDAAGNILFQSGHRDAGGNLFDELNEQVWADPALYDLYLFNLRGRMVRVQPQEKREVKGDRSVRISSDFVESRRNLNGTPVFDSANFDGEAVLWRLATERARRDGERTEPLAIPDFGFTLEEVFLQDQADAVVKNGVLPLQIRTARYPVSVGAETVGPLHVQVRLLFRNYPPFVLGQVLGLGQFIENLEVFEIAIGDDTANVS